MERKSDFYLDSSDSLELRPDDDGRPHKEREKEEETEEEAENTENTKRSRHNKKGGWTEKGLVERLVQAASFLNVTCLVYGGLYFVSLDIPFLLISTFHVRSRNVVTISLSLAWDTFLFSVACTWGIYALFMITSFVLTFKDTVTRISK